MITVTVATAICPEQLINVRQGAPPNPPLVRMVRNPDLEIITDSDVVARGYLLCLKLRLCRSVLPPMLQPSNLLRGSGQSLRSPPQLQF